MPDEIQNGKRLQTCTDDCPFNSNDETFCFEHFELYMKIKKNNPYWWTISPNLKEISSDDPDEIQKYIFKTFLIDLPYCCTDCICVTEFKDGRQHYHLFLSISNVKRFQILHNEVSKHCGIARKYKGEPKDGIHYLFKDILEAYEVLDSSPINYVSKFKDLQYERSQEKKRLKQEKKDRLLKEQLEVKKQYIAEIPKWMLEGHSTDSSEQEES